MAEKKEAINQFQVHHKIINIVLVKFDILNAEPISQEDKNKITFGVGLKFIIDEFEKTVKIEASFKVLLDLGTTQKLIAEMDTMGVFEVQNMEEILKAHNNSFPSSVVIMFSGILISTSRGFYILKSANTILEGVMLPVIDPTKLFQGSIKEVTNP